MNFRPAYLDTSAVVKLVTVEAETDALRDALRQWPDRVTSTLATVEVHRALQRAGATPADYARADAVLSSLVLLKIDDSVLRRAAAFEDPRLRALDGIHLAAALSLGDDPDVFITYDARLAEAASSLSLPVAHPGASRLGTSVPRRAGARARR